MLIVSIIICVIALSFLLFTIKRNKQYNEVIEQISRQNRELSNKELQLMQESKISIASTPTRLTGVEALHKIAELYPIPFDKVEDYDSEYFEAYTFQYQGSEAVFYASNQIEAVRINHPSIRVLPYDEKLYLYLIKMCLELTEATPYKWLVYSGVNNTTNEEIIVISIDQVFIGGIQPKEFEMTMQDKIELIDKNIDEYINKLYKYLSIENPKNTNNKNSYQPWQLH